MALSAQLEGLLAELGKVDPAAAQEQRKVLEKFASLQKPLEEGVLRQSDYSRYLNEHSKEIQTAKETRDWYQQNKPIFDDMKTRHEASEQEISRLKVELERTSVAAAAAAAAAGSPGGDPEKIAEAVKRTLGSEIPTKTELAALVAAETKKQTDEARSNFYKVDFPQSMKFMTGWNAVMFQHQQETGKLLDAEGFTKYMTENKFDDPVRAYEGFMSGTRESKRVEDEVAKRVDQWKKDNPAASGVPGSSGPATPGPLQVRLATRDSKDPLFGKDFELGDQTASTSAAAELRAEGRV
jgi:hypothetical protein